MKTSLRDSPIFICGHPKSGTSLVRALLDSHPQLVVYPEETVFFRRYLPKSKDLDLQAKINLADQCLIHIFKWNHADPTPDQDDFPGRDYSNISFAEVHQSMCEFVETRYQREGDMLSAAVMAFGQVSGQTQANTRYWVEKSPYNEYFTDQIFTWWPEARCIHIIRDPRDNYISYQRKHPDWTPEFFANNWKRSTQAGVRNQERFGAEKYKFLRYEDLVQKPEASIHRLANFLNIDWHLSLTAPTRAGVGWAGNSMFEREFQSISPDPVGRWMEDLLSQDARTIELIAMPGLDVFNYTQSAAVSTDPAQAIIGHSRALTWGIRRRLKNLFSNTKTS